MHKTIRHWFVRVLLLAPLAVGLAAAEEPAAEKKSWENKTELGLTSTAGNSEVTNLSLGNNYKHFWEHSELSFDLAAIKNESVDKFWAGAVGDEEIVERTTTTAETYTVGLGYRHDITGRLFWVVGGRWFRNEPAGLLDRYRGSAGVGYTFLESKKHTLLGEVGLAYTEDTKVVPLTVDPAGEGTETYTSATGLVRYKFAFSENAELTSDLDGFFDVSESENWQANWVTSVTASMTSNLALKVSYKIVYDNLPGFIQIPAGPGAGGTEAFSVEADTTDTYLTASVVLNF